MNQILVHEKVIVTPEFRRKKKIYKFNFFLSVFLMCSLFSCYIYAEYDRNKSEQVSQEILLGLQEVDETQAQMKKTVDNTTISVSDGVLYVTLLASTPEESNEVDVTKLLQQYRQHQNVNNSESETNIISTEETNAQIPTFLSTNDEPTIVESVTEDGTRYYSEAILKIESLDIEYPVLSDTSEELLKISLNKIWGPNPNEVGNYCIAGHNYKSGKMFGKLKQINTGDTFTLEDLSGRKLTYEVYDKYVIEPDDVACTSQLTGGRREVTLITCQNSGRQRLVIKAAEVI